MGGASTGSLHDQLTVRSGRLNDISNAVREIGQRLDPEKRARQYIRHIRSPERTNERFGTGAAPSGCLGTGDARRHVRPRPTGPAAAQDRPRLPTIDIPRTSRTGLERGRGSAAIRRNPWQTGGACDETARVSSTPCHCPCACPWHRVLEAMPGSYGILTVRCLRGAVATGAGRCDGRWSCPLGALPVRLAAVALRRCSTPRPWTRTATAGVNATAAVSTRSPVWRGQALRGLPDPTPCCADTEAGRRTRVRAAGAMKARPPAPFTRALSLSRPRRTRTRTPSAPPAGGTAAARPARTTASRCPSGRGPG